MKKTYSRLGFTLVEMLVVVATMGMLMTGVMSFYIQNLKGMYVAEQRLKLAGQIKKFSNELITQASRSNQFVLYKTANATDFDGPNAAPYSNNSDRQIIDVDDPLNPLHPAGDFVVFVFYEIPKPAAQPLYRISKLEGYFLTPNAGTIAALKKVVIDLSAAPSTSSIETILTANWSTATFTTYFPLVRGLLTPEVVDGAPVAGSTTPHLFYMSDARNVLISGQIYSSRPDIDTADWKTFTDSFFFNITPRT